MTTPQEIDSLNRRYGVPNQLRFAAGPGGFTVVEIDNAHARASLALEGGQVLTYTPAGQAPVVWLSPQARYEPGKSARGGIPVCWPWFGPHAGDPKQPAHGFARNSQWRVVETAPVNDGAVRIVIELIEQPEHRARWPHEARLQLHMSVGTHLAVELVTINTSANAIPLTEALHTYLHVGDIEATRIEGLNDTSYIDKVAHGTRAIQQGVLRISGETDRVYQNTGARVVVHDQQLKRRIVVDKRGSRSTVVWNPWIEKAQKLGDMGNDGYRHMLCIEAANALDDAVTVAPRSEHRLATTLHVEPEK